jgi:Ca2+-binding EF-hand superfamily protein
MGNTITHLSDVPVIILHNEVHSLGKLLIGCKTHSGTLTEIRRLFDKFTGTQAVPGYFLTQRQFKALCRNTALEHFEPQIFKQFSKNKARQMSFLELLGALVLFAITTWQHKVHFAMRLFDFDGNLCLSEDEFTILIAAFLNGLGYATGTRMPSASDLGKVSELLFKSADRRPDGLLTLDE